MGVTNSNNSNITGTSMTEQYENITAYENTTQMDNNLHTSMTPEAELTTISSFTQPPFTFGGLEADGNANSTKPKENTTSQKDYNIEDASILLPNDLVPYHYNLFMKPYIYKNATNDPELTFEGQVDIFFDCLEVTNVIVLNHLKLDIDNSSIQIMQVSPVNKDLSDSYNVTSYNVQLELYSINLNTNLDVNASYVIQLSFCGKLLKYSRGFFSSKYAMDGEIR